MLQSASRRTFSTLASTCPTYDNDNDDDAKNAFYIDMKIVLGDFNGKLVLVRKVFTSTFEFRPMTNKTNPGENHETAMQLSTERCGNACGKPGTCMMALSNTNSSVKVWSGTSAGVQTKSQFSTKKWNSYLMLMTCQFSNQFPYKYILWKGNVWRWNYRFFAYYRIFRIYTTATSARFFYYIWIWIITGNFLPTNSFFFNLIILIIRRYIKIHTLILFKKKSIIFDFSQTIFHCKNFLKYLQNSKLP